MQLQELRVKIAELKNTRKVYQEMVKDLTEPFEELSPTNQALVQELNAIDDELTELIIKEADLEMAADIAANDDCGDCGCGGICDNYC